MSLLKKSLNIFTQLIDFGKSLTSNLTNGCKLFKNILILLLKLIGKIISQQKLLVILLFPLKINI